MGKTPFSVFTSLDVILDFMGTSYYQRNLNSLNFDGRLFIVGFQGGFTTQVVSALYLPSALQYKKLKKKAGNLWAGLRNRSLERKAVIDSEVEKKYLACNCQKKETP
ncbi:hypothetical protein Fmac_011538 [Flemingia macrophylla]|uniref:Uncharacterized protein n=1 Tax=Flemingia macrophylla TaxID=520843 RepID=A0ABD1MMQ8_9FABA